MKVFAWVLIVFGIAVVILEGINYNKTPGANASNVLVEDEAPIGWQTYAGGAIAIIGTFLLANCERNKHRDKNE